jgi:hypothetical protein
MRFALTLGVLIAGSAGALAQAPQHAVAIVLLMPQ